MQRIFGCDTEHLTTVMPTAQRQWRLKLMSWDMQDTTPPRELGKGTFGSVQCRLACRTGCEGEGVEVAVKEYGQSDVDGVPYDVVRELAVLQHLGSAAKDHHIVHALGVSIRRADGIPRLVMKLAHRSLVEYMSTVQPMRVYQEWMSQLMCGVRYLHSMGVLHRDIKPGNVLVHRESEDERRLALADFGSSVIMYQRDQELEAGVCTFAYAAPEMLRSQAYGSAADVWSVGVTMADVYLHRRSFYGDTPEEILETLLRTRESVVRRLPEEWRDMLDMDVSKRPSTDFCFATRNISRRSVPEELHNVLDRLDSMVIFATPDVVQLAKHIIITDGARDEASLCAAICIAMKASHSELADISCIITRMCTTPVTLHDVVEAEKRMLCELDLLFWHETGSTRSQKKRTRLFKETK